MPLVVGVLFHPQAIKLVFGLAGVQMTDRILDLNEAVRPGTLVDSVINTGNIHFQIDVISKLLMQKLRQNSKKHIAVKVLSSTVSSKKPLTIAD